MGRKVILVGAGAVGTAYAYSLINQGFINELVIIDVNKEKAKGEAMDLVHGMAFASSNIHVTYGDYDECRDADIVCVTAGANQKPGETRLDLVAKNTKIMQSIVADVMKNEFQGIFLIASNPVDILSHVVQKASGFPANKVIGSGTTLDTARFKVMIGEYLEIDPRNVHALIIGEHGDSELPVWSQASIGTESLENFIKRRNNSEDWDNLYAIFDDTKNAAYEIINRKGVTNFGIGMSLARVTKAILNDENSILPVSCLLENKYAQNDIYMSVPAVVNRQGIKEVIELQLNNGERLLFEQSAEALRKARVE